MTRPDSTFFWLNLERPGQRVIRESTKIPVDGGSDKQTRENLILAKALYSARMGDLARGRHHLAQDKPRATFKAYRQWYLEHVSSTKRGKDREASMLRQLGDFFDAYDLADIDATLVREWVTVRKRQVKPRTVNREMEILKHLLKSAVPKYLDRSAIEGLPRLRADDDETRVLSHEEEPRLFAALTDLENRALVTCALDTLQRLTSVVSLKVSQDRGSYIAFVNTKTKPIKVPVSVRLRAILDQQRAALPDGGKALFPSYQGFTDAARRNRVIRMFRAACDAADIDDTMTFHCLRHTGATRMLEAGHNLETVRRIGGWATLTMLQRYLHPSDPASRAAVESIKGR